MREGLASALESRGWISGAKILDLYAGTGALAFEALSRGAVSAVLLEKNRRVARAIERSAGELGLDGRARVVVADLHTKNPDRWLREIVDSVDLVLIDPPYAEIERVSGLLAALHRSGRLAPSTPIAIEHSRKAPPELPRGFHLVSSYRYGDTAVVLATAPDEVKRA